MAACSVLPIRAPWQLAEPFLAATWNEPPEVTKLLGNSSCNVSGIASVALVPMYSHLPAGGLGVGCAPLAGCEGLVTGGVVLVPPSEVMTSTAITATTTTVATPIASFTEWCFDSTGRSAAAGLPRPGCAGLPRLPPDRLDPPRLGAAERWSLTAVAGERVWPVAGRSVRLLVAAAPGIGSFMAGIE